jgi:hypothetical protein
LVASNLGGFGSKEPEALSNLADGLEAQLSRDNQNTDSLAREIEDTLLDSVNRTYGGDISRRYRQTEDLVKRIQERITDIDDIREFVLAARAVVRTSEILQQTASFDRAQITDIVDHVLQDDSGTPEPSRAYEALKQVDIEGEAHQLGGQRVPLVEYVQDLLNSHGPGGRGVSVEDARVVSAIAQEYERRAGQSRSSTAGGVFEQALQRIFDRFSIPATGKPAHLGDLEIDNRVTGPAGDVGFSCKRTLRERFRQSLSREAEIDVDEVWFVALLVGDVSADKIFNIRDNSGRLYVPRESFVWERYKNDQSLTYALRPADEFVQDVRSFTGV